MLSSGFLVGIGSFQVPAGILTAKFGPRRIAILGSLIAFSMSTLTGVAANLTDLILLRFFVGIGMAMIFSPGLAMLTAHFKESRAGLAVGLYNSIYWVGALLGLSGWILVSELTGWRLSLIIAGVFGLATLVLLIIFAPKDSKSGEFTVTTSDLRRILLSRNILLVGFGVCGLNVALTIITTFTLYYMETALGANPELGGFVASLAGITSILVAPLAGRFFDRVRDYKRPFIFASFCVAAGLAVASLGTVATMVLATLLVGLGNGISGTAGFLMARENNPVGPRYETLSISLVNGISLSGSFWAPVVFSWAVISSGYSTAFLIMAVTSLIMTVPPMLAIKSKGRAPTTFQVVP